MVELWQIHCNKPDTLLSKFDGPEQAKVYCEKHFKDGDRFKIVKKLCEFIVRKEIEMVEDKSTGGTGEFSY